MKVKLRVHKGDLDLIEDSYDVVDAASFGNACADMWTRLRERDLVKATSIGALLEVLDERVIDELDGAELSISKS
jgi:hypothetical protein